MVSFLHANQSLLEVSVFLNGGRSFLLCSFLILTLQLSLMIFVLANLKLECLPGYNIDQVLMYSPIQLFKIEQDLTVN